jgi:hypothetical protein
MRLERQGIMGPRKGISSRLILTFMLQADDRPCCMIDVVYFVLGVLVPTYLRVQIGIVVTGVSEWFTGPTRETIRGVEQSSFLSFFC